MDAFSHDRYRIDQLVRPVVNLYQVTPVAGDGGLGAPVAFVRQKRMALKEDIRFFADEDENDELFRIKARRVIEVGGRYDVTAADGSRIGILDKLVAKSLVRSTWHILDANEERVALAEERSQFVAAARRLVDLVPYGAFVPIPYHFTISNNGTQLGELRRERSIRDRYTLDLSGDAEQRLDRRLAIALAIGLDAFQSR